MTRPSIESLVRRPIVVAPMGGGPSTPTLVSASAESDVVAFLAAGYKSVRELTNEVEEVRRLTTKAFGVNVFLPGSPTSKPEELRRYVSTLRADAGRLGVELGAATWNDDHWATKIDFLLASPVAIVSFTFGCPSPLIVRALQNVDTLVAVTVTNSNEALLAVEAGADFLCVQGIEAGAHRGTFHNDEHENTGSELVTLIGELARAVDVPLVGAGGVMSAAQVRAVIAAGAVAAQCGTAFLRCRESGASAVHKAALADERFLETAMTRSFSGRPARGLVNMFVLDHPDAVAAYPEINSATRPLRAAATRAGDVDRMSLWAGTGFKEATDLAAGEIIEQLCPW